MAVVDLLVVNEEELTLLAGSEGSIADRLERTGIRSTVVTLGSRGVCALIDGCFVLQPAFTVDPVDTTAAGDTFCGVLVAALAEGAVMHQAMARAAAAAALSTTRLGAQSSIPGRAEVDALLASGGLGDPAALADYCGIEPSSGRKRAA